MTESLGLFLRNVFSSFLSWLSASAVNVFILLGAIIAVPAFAAFLWKALFGYHARMKREARRLWKKIQDTPSDRDVFLLVRALPPFAFEELVVLALRKHGYRAWHGPRYTGDGGIDGWVRYGREKHPIQDKRYSGAINPRHVRDFSHICGGLGTTGLFVHTGTTGTSSWSAAANVRIISGRLLMGLLRKDRDFVL